MIIDVIELFLDEGSNPVLARVDDDFWDYDRQVDLEAFSTKQLFSDLSSQSQRVISTIDSQNEQVCGPGQSISDYGINHFMFYRQKLCLLKLALKQIIFEISG